MTRIAALILVCSARLANGPDMVCYVLMFKPITVLAMAVAAEGLPKAVRRAVQTVQSIEPG